MSKLDAITATYGDEAHVTTPVAGVPGHAPDNYVAGDRAPDRRALDVLIGAAQRVVSFPVMLASLLVAGVFWSGRMFVVNPDLWWHIKVGDDILAAHKFPTVDIYSFTVAGQPWMAYEWFGEVVFSWVHRVGGLRGLDMLLIALGSTVLIALYYLGTLRSGNSKGGFVSAAVLLILATVSFSMRPQMLGYLFLVLTMIVLERFRQGKSGTLWLLPPLFLLWVNTHGSFVIGLGAIGLYYIAGLKKFEIGDIEGVEWSQRERTQLSFAFLLCLIALTITPYGTRLAAYPFDMALNQPVNVSVIQEWQPIPFNNAVGKFFLVLLLGFAIVQLTKRFKWRPEEMTLFLFGVTMACIHVRFILLFVPFFTPLFATVVARWMDEYNSRKDKYPLNAVIMALIVVGMIHYFPTTNKIRQATAAKFAVNAVDYLKHHPLPEPMFNTYGAGGYLVWAMGPQHKVFIDGRGDVYEHGGVLSDYSHIATIQPGTLKVLDGYGIQSCLVERDEALATLLAASGEWNKVYSDNVSALYVRKSASE